MTPIEAVVNFYFPGCSVKNTEQLSGGLINQTYRVELNDGQTFIVQKVNTSVFQNVAEVHSNISVVAAHLSLLDYRFEFPAPIKNESGTDSIEVEEKTWRVLPYVEGCYSAHQVSSEKMAYNAGQCLGHFHSCLIDLSTEKLKVTLPDFHSGELRINQLEEAISNSETPDLEFVNLVREEFHILKKWDKIITIVPTRIAHFDTKIENFLFKNETEEVAALIDLDTLMPGSVLSDVGDMIRSFCDEGTETPKADFVQSLLDGYKSAYSDHLTQVELENLEFSGAALTLMQSVRFLTDYLNGDTYYQTEFEGQNLIRAQRQFALYQGLLS